MICQQIYQGSDNKMEKGTTIFYQKHINSNIARFDERKDKFINYRLQFLRQYCEPIQQKIRHIYSEIDRYKIMRDTQQQVIEKEPDIARLKEEVDSYNHTHKYFNDKLSQYEKKSLQLQQYNVQLKKQVLTMKKQYKNQQQEGQMLLSYMERSNVKSVHSLNENRQNTSKSFVLPRISNRLDTSSSISSSKVTIHPKKIVDISQKIQKYRSLRPMTEDMLPTQQNQSIIKEDPRLENTEEYQQKKKKLQSIRQRMTQFNKIESLFHQCFEVKKNSVQRSVSQLQSKLIGNRQEFLKTCHAIGSKQEKVNYDTFNKLSGDQILTLFISFVWLNKRINADFQAKRKLIMDFVGKLPKLDKQY